MQVSTVSNNSFEGNAIFNPNLPKHLKSYANLMLDSVVEGQPIREKLAKKTFDITFFTSSSKKAIKPRLEFYAGFKVLNPKDKKYYNSRIRMDNNYDKNAKKISEFIDRVEDAKKSYNGYNTFGERIKNWYHDFMMKLISEW